ncbi:AMP-binding protein [Achromobacter pestifer]|uniref:AMP-binding protein n=1 Tax=Achromobacter pestifer TaxID=1353889 RepID=UPI0020B83ABB|nr:AMP-binding protein [Achromobacter pestifer]
MTKSSEPQEKFVHPENFVDRLRQLAASRPEDIALTVVSGREGEIVETVLTYRAFAQRVLALAAALQDRYGKGDRVLILLDNDEHYAVSMFACFHAGVIAVPAFPPESARPQHLARLAGIAEDAQARGVLTTGALRALVGEAARLFGVPDVVAVDEVDPAAAGRWRPQTPDGADIAFLQYTSGSTSAPKGVMVTHANLMANERAIRAGLSIGSDDKFGVWSPLFHDMGLIGGLLQPFYSGIPCVLSSSRFFLERPVRWLEMISRHRITISGGPDFAYRLCLDRVKEDRTEGLDLSSWRVTMVRKRAHPALNFKLRDLMQKPTISGLLGIGAASGEPTNLVLLNSPVAEAPPLFCIHAGFGTIFDYRLLAQGLQGTRAASAQRARR